MSKYECFITKKDSFPQKLVNVYHKVFPSADKRYWSTYKSKICDEIKNLSVSDLSWEIIKGRAELESKLLLYGALLYLV